VVLLLIWISNRVIKAESHSLISLHRLLFVISIYPFTTIFLWFKERIKSWRGSDPRNPEAEKSTSITASAAFSHAENGYSFQSPLSSLSDVLPPGTGVAGMADAMIKAEKLNGQSILTNQRQKLYNLYNKVMNVFFPINEYGIL